MWFMGFSRIPLLFDKKIMKSATSTYWLLCPLSSFINGNIIITFCRKNLIMSRATFSVILNIGNNNGVLHILLIIGGFYEKFSQNV
jgi:hypothetical protein